MGKIKQRLMLTMLNIVTVAFVTSVFGVCWLWFYAQAAQVGTWETWCVIALFCVIYCLMCHAYDAFEVALQGLRETVGSQLLALLVTHIILYCVTCLLVRRAAAPLPFLASWIVGTVCAALWSAVKRKWYFSACPAKRSVIVYDGYTNVCDMIAQYGLEKNFAVTDAVEIEACLADLSVLDGAEVVFLSNVSSDDRNEILKYCVARNTEVYLTPRIGDTLMQSARQVRLFHLPVLCVGGYQPPILYLALKRAFDLLASALALLLLSPVFLITAICIKVCDGGPVFYTQERLTKGGKVFKIHKFRSMRVDAEKDGVARLSTGAHDDRITPVGRVIRKLHIDELPQLVDILRGDLSVVGPRPERPEIAAQYEAIMPEFRLRLQAKAGLTGCAQVYGKYNTRPYDKLKMDLMYIAHPSVLQDLRLCFLTVKTIFLPESTEGVAEGQTTAETDQTKRAKRETVPLNKAYAQSRLEHIS